MSESHLSVFDKHQLRIARATLKMKEAMVNIMGGMTKDEALAVIKRLEERENERDTDH